ncbi:hypothetical protein VUR80DRAFT_2630 [Thermomyces stellatus]
MPAGTDTENSLSSSEGEDTERTLHGDSDLENESEDSGAGKGRGGFFDLEAADSEDGDSSEEGEEEPDAGSEDGNVEPLFPRFMYLPPELRRRIWEFFCPEVLGMPRILEFVWDMGLNEQSISEGSSTDNVTEPSRTLAAVHRETREIALRAFPEALKLSDRRGLVRFSAHWDIVMLQHVRQSDADQEWRPVSGFSKKVTNLAINLDTLSDMPNNVVESLVKTFPKLRILYPYFQRHDYEAETIWVDSDKVNRFTLRTVDDTAGLMRQEERLYVWPDLVNHKEFAVENIGPEFIRLGKIWPMREGDEGLEDYPAEMWPMVEWVQDDPSEFEDEVEDGFEDEEPFDTLGSQGYDSDEIDQFADPLGHALGEMDSEEDLDRYEDDFVVHDGLVEYDEDHSDGLEGESEAEDTDGEQDHPTLDHPGAYTVDPPAEFSDLEPESDEETSDVGRQGSGDDESGDESGTRQVPVRSRLRRTVVSEDEEDEEHEDGEDEDDDVRRAPVRSRARRTVISEDEDEDEGDDDDAGQAPVRRRGRRVVVSEDEDEDE